MTKTLVAGIGNVLLGDDGFGVEVAARLAMEPLPEGVRVLDAGIRARHLAYELLDGAYDTAILVDAVSRGGAPGTIYLIDPEAGSDRPGETQFADAHSMNPETVLAFLRMLGRTPARVLIVGCEPAHVDEGMGLSTPVAGAVDEALAIVRELLEASRGDTFQRVRTTETQRHRAKHSKGLGPQSPTPEAQGPGPL